MKKILHSRAVTAVSAVVLAVCLCLTVFVGLPTATTLASGGVDNADYWDGTAGGYANLNAVKTAMGTPDENGFYSVTTAEQLYAIIKYNGGGLKYKLTKNMVLNENYANYASWDTTAPTNNWDFSTSSNNTVNKFSGTINGQGYTVYGLYSGSANGYYSGFIGPVGEVTTVENLNFTNSCIRVRNRGAVIVGGCWYDIPDNAIKISITGCSVKNAKLYDAYNNGPAGALVGLTCRTTRINACAVEDVAIISSAGANDTNGISAIGSMVGALYSHMISTASAGSLDAGQAARVNIANSYSVNVTKALGTGTPEPAYIMGLYTEGNGNKWAYSATVNNVYADTNVPVQNKAGTVKFLVTTDGTANAISHTSPNYPIKTVAKADIIGENAKIAMPNLDWNETWFTKASSSPIYKDIYAGVNIWSGTGTKYMDSLTWQGTGTKADPYLITSPDHLYTAVTSGGGKIVNSTTSNSNYYHFKLTTDIVLNKGYSKSSSWGSSAPANNWGATAVPLAIEKNFTGEIDGDGHTIYGMYSKKATWDTGGLLPRTGGDVVVKNLHFRNGYVSARDGASAIIGYVGGKGTVQISNCTVGNYKFFVEGTSTHTSAGAFVGKMEGVDSVIIRNSSVTDCELKNNTAAQKGWHHLGAFVGADITNLGLSAADEFNASGCVLIQIYNSYAANVINTSEGANNAKLHYMGIHSTDADNYKHSYTANGSYTDAASNLVRVRTIDVPLYFSESASAPALSETAVGNIDVTKIKGTGAKIEMPKLDWCIWQTVADSYPMPLGAHTLQKTAGNPATCYEGGTIDYWTCTECGNIYSDGEGIAKIEIENITVQPYNHSKKIVNAAKSPTCTEDGNLAHCYCPDCDKYYTNSLCNEEISKDEIIIPKLAHRNKLYYPASQADCVNDGYAEYWHCPDCNKYFTDEACTNAVKKNTLKTENALGHGTIVFVAGTKGDSCTNPDTIDHYECTVCGDVFSDEMGEEYLDTAEILWPEHDVEKVEAKSATCTERGNIEHYKCKDCGKLFTTAEHNVLLSEADAITYPINHENATHVSATKPTCLLEGYREHWYCADCDSYFADENCTFEREKEKITILATGHVVTTDTHNYDYIEHWNSCDNCVDKVAPEVHSYGKWSNSSFGQSRNCLTCDYVDFKFVRTVKGITLDAQPGAFDLGSSVSVENITDNYGYSLATAALATRCEKMKIYNIAVKYDSLAVQPRRSVELSVTVPDDFSENVELFHITSYGIPDKIETTLSKDGKTLTATVTELGITTLVDYGDGSDSPVEEEPDIDNTKPENDSAADDDTSVNTEPEGDTPELQGDDTASPNTGEGIAVIASSLALLLAAVVVLLIKLKKA